MNSIGNRVGNSEVYWTGKPVKLSAMLDFPHFSGPARTIYPQSTVIQIAVDEMANAYLGKFEVSFNTQPLPYA